MPEWNEIVDVVVMGSGAAGLSAAISARHFGATVLVLERSSKLGGTSAVSAGVPWIPNNHHMHEIGSSDSREQALTYLRSLSLGGMDMGLAETYVDEGPEVLRFLEAQTPLTFQALRLPDYHPEHPGGTFGRSVTPQLFPAGELGELRPHLRPAPCFPIPLTMADLEDGTNLFDPELMGERIGKDLVGAGGALIAGMIKGATDKGIELRRNVRVLRLVMDGDVVTGIEAEGPTGPVRIGARRAVILASGGFEWNAELVKDFVAGPVDGPCSPPFNEGDGFIMAREAQAATALTQEAWWMPMVRIPGDEYEGQQLNRLAVTERTYPCSIMVNRAGNRFVNEAHNYNDVGRAMHNFDAVAFDYPNLPAWIVFDQYSIDHYPFGTRYPGDPVPRWMITAPTLRELAAKIEVDADGLEATVKYFNEHALKGEDPQFHRGRSAYDQYYGDTTCEGAFRTLGPVAQAPFFACRIYSGVLGTKGGPKTSSKAEVISLRGGRIPGLYAAGNAAASFTGMAYPGAGATIGPAIVFGHIAGREAAGGTNRL